MNSIERLVWPKDKASTTFGLKEPLPGIDELLSQPVPEPEPAQETLSLAQKRAGMKPIELIRAPDEQHRLPNSLEKVKHIFEKGYQKKGHWERGCYIIPIEERIKSRGILRGKHRPSLDKDRRWDNFSCYELGQVEGINIEKDQIFAHIMVLEEKDESFISQTVPIMIREVYGHIKVPCQMKCGLKSPKRTYQVFFTDSKDYSKTTRVYAKTTFFEIISDYLIKKREAAAQNQPRKYSRIENE